MTPTTKNIFDRIEARLQAVASGISEVQIGVAELRVLIEDHEARLRKLEGVVYEGRPLRLRGER